MSRTAIEVIEPSDRSGDGPTFHVRTAHTSLVLRVTRFGHLDLLHYGDRVTELAALGTGTLHADPKPGMSVMYDEDRDPAYALDVRRLAWSGMGKGDFREPPMEIRMPDRTFVADLTFGSYRVQDGPVPCEDGLPTAIDPDGEAQTLIVTLTDGTGGIEADLLLTAYPATDVIARRTVLRNVSDDGLVIRRLMSSLLDLPDLGFDLVTFDGTWISEGHEHRRPLGPGLYVNASLTGSSSNRHNPGVLLAERVASEDHGAVYGFNLVYSGNHWTGVEFTVPQHGVRVLQGINPTGFEWDLGPGGRFETPEAVMTFSRKGFGGVGDNWHRFVGRNIVRGEWADKERPVKLNTWESSFFDIDERNLTSMARAGAKLGAELFVLDDGWFGAREDDTKGLGDWVVNERKLPHGMAALADRVHDLGMLFGLWFEPECVNPDSDLFRAHPDWVIRAPGRTPSRQRHQLMLDLSRAEVRDHLVDAIGAVLDSASIDYVKWDMNRHLSDVASATTSAGEVMHRQVLGLYDVLTRIFGPRPRILLETCSSGGNRFDLGMLCHSPQIWTSDCTDPIERLDIQLGLARLYPRSTMGAHVSESPHQQTLRATPLSTRFNVAALGVLGYELDPRHLDPAERKEVRRQIAFYKEHRRLLQFGRLHRADPIRPEQVDVTITEEWGERTRPRGIRAIHGHFQTRTHAAQRGDRLPIRGLDPARTHRVTTFPQGLSVAAFGGLLRHVLPGFINPRGMLVRRAAKVYRMPDATQEWTATGATLAAGIALPEQFVGEPYDEATRMLADFGSNLYLIEECA